MHRLVAAAHGMGAADVFAQEASTGYIVGQVLKGRLITNSAEGSPQYNYHGLSFRGLPKFSVAHNSWVNANGQQTLANADNWTAMGYWIYPNEVVGAGSAVCGGLAQNRSFGWVMHRNGHSNYAMLFQNSGWADMGIPMNGGLHMPRQFVVTREGGQWYAHFNGVKTGSFGAFGPSMGGNDTGVFGGGNSIWVYSCFAAYWDRVLTQGEIFKLLSMMRNTRGIESGLAA